MFLLLFTTFYKRITPQFYLPEELHPINHLIPDDLPLVDFVSLYLQSRGYGVTENEGISG